MIIPYVPPATCQGTRSLCLPFWREGYADCGCGLEWRRAVRLGIEIGCRHSLSSGTPLSSSHLLPINLRKHFKNPLLCPEFGGWGQRGRERICRDKPCSGKKTLLPKIKIWEVSWELRLGENTLGKAVAFTRHFTAGHLNASRFRFLFLSKESLGLTRQLAPRNQNCSLSTLTSKYIAQNWLGVDEESNSLNKTSCPFIGGSWTPWLFSTLRSTPTSPGAAWRPLPFSLRV